MKSFATILIFLFANTVWCQEFDKLTDEKVVNCQEIANTGGLCFTQFMASGKTDSATLLLKYWEKKCGMSEPVFRAKLLLLLAQGVFHDSLFKGNMLKRIFNYRERMQMIRTLNYEEFENHKVSYGYVPPGQEFDRFTTELAGRLKMKYRPETLEYLLLDLYSTNNDALLTAIQEGTWRNMHLATEYRAEVENYLKIPEFHFAFLSGVWAPTGALKVLGTHPELGFAYGLKHKKISYDIVATFKFIKSQNSYMARRSIYSNYETTDRFMGYYIGFDVGRDIFSKRGNEVQLIGGIAFDGFEVLRPDPERNIPGVSASSYNFSLGLSYRNYIRNSFYVGLRSKYNIVDYTLNRVINFTGNPVTVHFSIGFLIDEERNDKLRKLRYRVRR